MNHYANKKSAAESMLDIALLMANASQLKAVIEQGTGFAFFIPLVVLISISLALQIGVGVLLIFLGMTSTTLPSMPSWTSSTTWPLVWSSSSSWSTSSSLPLASRSPPWTWRPSSRCPWIVPGRSCLDTGGASPLRPIILCTGFP
nr:ninjurin-1 isoform X7 [Odocoileus virginianus texanus]XP_020765163.1 ninjurin-1 isoform X7 [Odocoileus virginianus texanus]XP_020765164.1 ninjurin-1 isoform X7 [Odocoileus virginianus texanus]XP_020765165.1 ninjurin-1 isoform X7 [Odocoileus virginianus texanus]XP_020765166.1 ninjurin-1 isoform X7 [Odocoileus virginianus texanus]